MKKHNRNTTLPAGSHNNPLTVRRETVRLLTGDDLAVIAGGSSTTITDRTTTHETC